MGKIKDYFDELIYRYRMKQKISYLRQRKEYIDAKEKEANSEGC